MKKVFVWIGAALLAVASVAVAEEAPGIITTIAGTGVPGYSGDGVPAIRASLWNPYGVAADANGSVYIADALNHRIRQVRPDGVITTVAGTGTAGYSGDGGPAAQASLNTPYGVAVDAQGSVYIADWGNRRIRCVGTDGDITTVAGNGTESYSGDGSLATETGMDQPWGVAIDASGTLYMLEVTVSFV